LVLSGELDYILASTPADTVADPLSSIDAV